jgi:predicted nucleic acid-binding protein
VVQLGLLAVTGLAGCLIGGTAGIFIAAVGVLPLVAVAIARRRCLGWMTFARADELMRAVRWLDALSWPVALQAFNLSARDEACVLAGEPAGLTAHISRFRRHTRAARLMLAVEAVDAEAVSSMSREMLPPGNALEDRVMAANLLAYHDLGAVIDWYRSAGLRRLHGRGNGRSSSSAFSCAQAAWRRSVDELRRSANPSSI